MKNSDVTVNPQHKNQLEPIIENLPRDYFDVLGALKTIK